MNTPVQLDQLVLEIRFYSQQTALNMIEVGKRLIQAKEQVAHGEWAQWLSEKVDYSQERARQFMRVAEEFGNSNTCWNLTPSKIIALLDLPANQRETFIQENHVSDMTTRELQAAIKAQKEAESKAETERQRADKLSKLLEAARTKAETVGDIEEENETLRAANKQLEKNLREAGSPIVVETPVQVVPPDYERIKTELAQLKATQIKKIDINCKEYNQKIDDEVKFAKAIFDAIFHPLNLDVKYMSQAPNIYLEYHSPVTVNATIQDCENAIQKLTMLKQAFEQTKCLKVVKG